MNKFSYNASGTQVTDELKISVGASAFSLEHDTFFDGADLVIYTGAGSTGTHLIQNTHYTVNGQNTRLSTKIGKNVYTTITITNGTYQTGSLYFTYKTPGDFAKADDINYVKDNMSKPTIDTYDHRMAWVWPWIYNRNGVAYETSLTETAGAVMYDGTNVYSANGANISKMNKTTGAVVASAATSYIPNEMVSDGTNLFGGGKKISPTNMGVVGTYGAAKNSGYVTGNSTNKLSQTLNVPSTGIYALSALIKSSAAGATLSFTDGTTTKSATIPQSGDYVYVSTGEIWLTAGTSVTVNIAGPAGVSSTIRILEVNLFTYNNKISNPGFESAGGYSLVGSNLSRTTDMPHTGTYSERWTIAYAQSAQVYTSVADLPPGTYDVGFWVNGSGSAYDVPVNLVVSVDGVQVYSGSSNPLLWGKRTHSTTLTQTGTIEVKAYVPVVTVMSPTGYIWFDDFFIINSERLNTDSIASANVLTNPNFESGATGWTATGTAGVSSTGLEYAKETMTYDGQYVYIGYDYKTAITRINSSSLATTDYNFSGSCNSLIYSNGYLWKANDTTIYKINPSDMTEAASYTSNVLSMYKCRTMVITDGLIYVFTRSSFLVVLTEKLTLVGAYDISATAKKATSVTADLENIYACYPEGNIVYKFAKVKSGDTSLTVVGSKTMANVSKVCFDGNVLYFTKSKNTSGNTYFDAVGVSRIGG